VGLSDNATSRGRKALVVALVLGLVAWIVWATEIATTGFESDVDGNVLGVDHSIFHAAGGLIASGKAADVYEPGPFREVLQDVRGHAVVHEVTFLNPPAMAFLFVPTAGLDRMWSWGVWSLVGFVAIALAYVLIGLERWWWPALLTVFSLPGLIAFRLGQPAFLWAGAMAAIYWGLRSDRQVLAGLTAGLLVVKPQYAIPLAFWWFMSGARYRRALWSMVVAGGFLATASFLLIPGSFSGFLAAASSAANGQEFPAGYSLRDALGAFSAISPKVAAAISGLLGACVVWFANRHRSEDLPTMFAATVLAAVLIPPHILIYDWCLLGVAVAVLWRAKPAQRFLWEVVAAGIASWSWLTWMTAVMIDVATDLEVQLAAFGLLLIGVSSWVAMNSIEGQGSIAT